MAQGIRAMRYFVYDGSTEGATRVKGAIGRSLMYVTNLPSAGNSGTLHFQGDVGQVAPNARIFYYLDPTQDNQEVFIQAMTPVEFSREYLDILEVQTDVSGIATAVTAVSTRVDTVETAVARGRGVLEKAMTKTNGQYEDFVVPLSPPMPDDDYNAVCSVRDMSGASATPGQLHAPIIIAQAAASCTVRVGAQGNVSNKLVRVYVSARK